MPAPGIGQQQLQEGLAAGGDRLGQRGQAGAALLHRQRRPGRLRGTQLLAGSGHIGGGGDRQVAIVGAGTRVA